MHTVYLFCHFWTRNYYYMYMYHFLQIVHALMMYMYYDNYKKYAHVMYM